MKPVHHHPTLSMFAFLAAAVALVSCEKTVSNEDLGNYPEDGIVRISTSLDEALTRADSPYSGNNLGVFIYYSSGDYYNAENVLWEKNAEDWVPEKQILWKSPAASAGIYAYAPYINGANDYRNIEFQVPSYQVNGTSSADFLWSSRPGFVPKDDLNSDKKLDILLTHALVKLTVNLSWGGEFSDSQLTVKNVTLNGTAGKLKFDLQNRTIAVPDPTATSDISMYRLEDGSYEAIFYPGLGQESGAKMLTVLMSDNKGYHVTLDNKLTLYPGHAYTMNVKVGKDKVTAGNVIVQDWEPEEKLDDKESYVEEFSVWDGTSSAGFTSGNGSEESPYEIETAAQLAYLKTALSGSYPNIQKKYYILKSNIDLAGKSWTPIGSNTAQNVCISLDGNGKTITNLMVSVSGQAGLFTGLAGDDDFVSCIKNLTIRNADVTSLAGNDAGIIAGYINHVDISNCKVEGRVTGRNAGGFAGIGYGVNITNSNADVTVTATSTENAPGKSGGIVGMVASGTKRGNTIDNCLVTGKIANNTQIGVSDSSSGGIAGYCIATSMKGCTSYADIVPETDAQMYIGGICGKVGLKDVSSQLSVENCSAFGTIYARQGRIGGAFGDAHSTNTNVHFGGNIDVSNLSTEYNNAENSDGTKIGIFVGYAGKDFNAKYCSFHNTSSLSLPVYGYMECALQDIKEK